MATSLIGQGTHKEDELSNSDSVACINPVLQNQERKNQMPFLLGLRNTVTSSASGFSSCNTIGGYTLRGLHVLPQVTLPASICGCQLFVTT